MHGTLCTYSYLFMPNGCGVYSTEIFSYGQTLLVTWLYFLCTKKKVIFLKETKLLVFKLKWLSSGEKKWTLEIQDAACSWLLLQLWFSTW